MAVDFNGSTDQWGTAIDAALRPSLPISVGAWINPDALVNGAGIYTNNKTDAQHRGLWMALSGTGGNVEVSYGDNSGSSSASRRSKVAAAGVTTGAWQYVSCSVRGATDMSIYRNGSDVGGSYSGTGTPIAYNAGVAGRIGSVGGTFFDGRIAQVCVWTVSLSAAEHLALASGVSPLMIRPLSLIQFFPMWYGAAIDLSSLALNATSTAGTAANHAPTGPPFPVAA